MAVMYHNTGHDSDVSAPFFYTQFENSSDVIQVQ